MTPLRGPPGALDVSHVAEPNTFALPVAHIADQRQGFLRYGLGAFQRSQILEDVTKISEPQALGAAVPERARELVGLRVGAPGGGRVVGVPLQVAQVADPLGLDAAVPGGAHVAKCHLEPTCRPSEIPAFTREHAEVPRPQPRSPTISEAHGNRDRRLKQRERLSDLTHLQRDNPPQANDVPA